MSLFIAKSFIIKLPVPLYSVKLITLSSSFSLPSLQHRYLEVLQKQRVEFEDLSARKLREQEDALKRQANAAIQAKDESIQSVINAAAEA